MYKYILFLMSFFLICISTLLSFDIINISHSISSIENISTFVSKEISNNGGITNSIKQYVKKSINADIYCAMDNCNNIKIGDSYIYIISKEIYPILLINNPYIIKISKTIIIGNI